MKKQYQIHSGDIIRHGSGDGWIQFIRKEDNGFIVTDADVDDNGNVAPVNGTWYLISNHDALDCVHEETGETYDAIDFIE